jgi:hydroxymethylpyrimidine pyrophosphatase-like HAD family hydrolase
MRFRVLACDYDATIAVAGQVDEQTRHALRRVRESGRRLLLVTGRTGAELANVFDGTDLFDRVVLENGALIVDPASTTEHVLAAPVPEVLIAELRGQGVSPLILGRVICSTKAANAPEVFEVIERAGSDVTAILNRDSLMILPRGTDKATGLQAALSEVGEPLDAVVAVGDGQNDLPMLDIAGAAVAVQNALDVVKQRVDVVLDEPGAQGILRLCESLLEHDLGDLLGAAQTR